VEAGQMSAKALDRMVSVIKSADLEKPPAEARAELAALLRDDPAVWRAAGDMVEQAARSLIATVGRQSYAVRQSMTAGWEQLPRDLARPGYGELERLLVQQVAISWLYLSFVEYNYSAVLTDTTLTITRGDYWERRMGAAQQRYLRAVENLARVRRLQLPAVQVNIAEQQVNQVNTRG